MKKPKCNRYSGIGGQAVLEGIMMKNKDEYAVAVRRPDGEIEIDKETFEGVLHGKVIKKIPFIRGIFNFLDSMVLGMKTLTYSAGFYDDEEVKETFTDKAFRAVFREKAEKVLMGITIFFSIALAVGIFIVLPYYISSYFQSFVRNMSLIALIEGIIRIVIFVLYVVGISLMKDIRRMYMYHGAEHKCINCIEKGKPLTVRNVMKSSRQHKRCGTSFMLFVMFVSIILFFFIRVENPVYRVLVRIALIPVIAGISYEIIRLAGKSNNIFVRIISAPGMLLQKLTTREPDESMVEVAIVAVEAIFDWKQYLSDNFGYSEETADSDIEENDENELQRSI